jgi:hypothetical protein
VTRNGTVAVQQKRTISIQITPRQSAKRAPGERVPRLSRLLALAIRCDGLLREGVIANYAELAQLAHVSRARVTQIMNLLNLAPDLQERLLFAAPAAGSERLSERAVRTIAQTFDWDLQRRLFDSASRSVRESRSTPLRLRSPSPQGRVWPVP